MYIWIIFGRILLFTFIKNFKLSGLENWRDLINQYVKDDSELQRSLVDLLCQSRYTDPDVDEATFWVKKLNLKGDDVPYDVKINLGMVEDNQTGKQNKLVL